MEHDVYVDCPSCGHTLKVANDLVGAVVECPDCSYTFEVPDIREGLNPRFREDLDQGLRDELPNLTLLHTGLKSLSRRNRGQIEQIELLHENTDLLLKQVNLLKQGRFPASADEKSAAPANTATPPIPELSPGRLRWSLICGCVSFAAALAVVIAVLVF